MDKTFDYGGGIKVHRTGSHPVTYLTGEFPCGASLQQKKQAESGDSEALSALFAEEDAKFMVSGHIANCMKCKAARDAARPPT